MSRRALAAFGFALVAGGASGAAEADIELATAESFPARGDAVIVVRVELGAGAAERIELHYQIESAERLLRYFRIYIDGKRVHTRIVKSRARGRVRLPTSFAKQRRRSIMFVVTAANDRPWKLVGAKLTGVDGVVVADRRRR